MVCLAASALLTLLMQSPSLPVAVTESGMRLQCVDAEVGDREIHTPFGLYRNATDPVVRIVDGSRQVEDFRRLRDAGIVDNGTWLQDLSTAGQLDELVRASQEFLALEPQRLEPYLILETWGQRLDPVPSGIDRRDRVAWLWDQVQREKFPTSLLMGAKLVHEVSASSSARHGRIIALSDLRKALRSPDVVARRIAARIAGRQQEISLRETLMEASLFDAVEAARDGAAEGVHGIHAQSARLYWLKNLARGQAAAREHAARNLGRYGGADGLRSLLHVLAASDSPAGTRLSFSGRRIQVVRKVDRDARDLIAIDSDLAEAEDRIMTPDSAFLEFGATLEVTQFGESLQTAILEALDTWAGHRTGRPTSAWFDFYHEEWLPMR